MYIMKKSLLTFLNQDVVVVAGQQNRTREVTAD